MIANDQTPIHLRHLHPALKAVLRMKAPKRWLAATALELLLLPVSVITGVLIVLLEQWTTYCNLLKGDSRV